MSNLPPKAHEIVDLMHQHFLGKPLEDTASPTGNWLRITLLRAAPGDIVISLKIRPEMTNPYGGIHGGMMATLCDEAIGWAIMSLGLEQHYTTVNLATDFLYTAMAGEVLRAHGRIVRHGKKIVNAEVHVYNEEDRLLAHTTSNLVATGMKIPAEDVFHKGIRI